jgi:cold-inducible RNA-binding protein
VAAPPVLHRAGGFILIRFDEETSMDYKLYVGNLSYDTSEDDLRTLFAASGTVVSVALIKDRATGRSKGFAFVEMSSQIEAEQAIKTLNGATVDNREIKVNKARPPEERSFSGSGGYNNNRSSGKGNSRDRNRRSNKGSPHRY